MISETSVREHTSADFPMQLLTDGSPIDLTGVYAVRLDIIDCHNSVHRYSSHDDPTFISISVTPTDGTVTLYPSENLFEYQNSPYKVYAWVYVTSAKKYSVPEDDKNAAIINVLKEY